MFYQCINQTPFNGLKQAVKHDVLEAGTPGDAVCRHADAEVGRQQRCLFTSPERV